MMVCQQDRVGPYKTSTASSCTLCNGVDVVNRMEGSVSGISRTLVMLVVLQILGNGELVY